MVMSAEEAIAKAKQVLNNMGFTLYHILEVLPGKMDNYDVWYVRARTVYGMLEIIIDRSRGEVLAVRRVSM